VRHLRPAIAALLVALLFPAVQPVRAAQPTPQPGRIVERTFTNSAGTRAYDLYVPAAASAGRPLMVWLHGCGVPGQMEAGHALARVAEERGFALAFPLQDRAANAQDCWNWFDPTSMHRGSGEASILAGITTSLIGELGIDPTRVYIGGYSAGGAMSTVMGAAYPDLYAAIAPSAGAPYAFDGSGRKAYQEMGPRARPVPAFILQGVTDEISNYAIGRINMAQWLGTDDLADDGQQNGSVSLLPSAAEPMPPGPRLPVPLLLEHYRAADGCDVGRLLTSPAEHVVNGALFYYDAGLGLQRLMMDFLLAHRLGVAHRGCG